MEQVNKRWSADETDRLINEYYEKNMSVPEIADLHNRTVESVQSKIKAMKKLKRKLFIGKPWSISETLKLIDEVEKGLSLGQIADLHQRSDGDIVKKLRQISKNGVRKLPSQLMYDMETLTDKEAVKRKKSSPTIASYAAEAGKLKALQQRRDKVLKMMEESVEGWIAHQREYNNLSMHIERLEVSLGIKKTEYDYQADSLPMQYQSAFNNMNYRF